MINSIFLPLRLLFSHEFVSRTGLKSIQAERYDIVSRHCSGRLLDIGCGDNRLVKQYGMGVGVDVYDLGGGSIIVNDTSCLNFADGCFDTVSFVASLNHIPNRKEVVREAHRVLSVRGRVVLTMLSPLIGKIRHKLATWDVDQNDRGMKDGEEKGLSHKYILSLFEDAGFVLVKRKRIMLLNNLYIFEKR